MSKVYFIEAKDGIIGNLEVLLEKAGVSNLTGVTAVKTHMGERKNKTFIQPSYVKRIVEVLKNHGGDPFVTDTTTM